MKEVDGAKCPRCRVSLFHDAEETPGGNVAIRPGCPACNWEPVAFFSEYPVGGAEAAKAEALATLSADVSPLAWFEPRERLPTFEEEAAHTARHGEAAGWMYSWFDTERPDDGWTRYTAPLVTPLDRSIQAPATILFRCYPHVGGRPVGWPVGEAVKSDNCRRCETREERERLLARLLAAWDAVPALRLGQLIRNSVPITGRGNDIFAVEDADLITQVETFVKGHKSAP